MHFFTPTRIFAAVFALLIPMLGTAVRQKEPQETADPASALERRLETGKVGLKYDEERGYLSAVLKELKVPVSSQTLVFSKSSFQLTQISPEAPRAVYFNDDTYVGWVNHGQYIEIASIDPKTGPVFYTLSQDDDPNPRLELQSEQCLVCHDTFQSRTPIPRLLILSVLPNPDGNALKAAALITNDQSPLRERWGGWYVTGTHGKQRHLGNTIALMLLGHQTHVHNLITSGVYEIRDAIQQDLSGKMSEIVKDAGEPIVRAMLFSGEAQLTEPVMGTSDFAAEFMSRGPRDSKGRSLRELDLKQRLLRYPLSYLVYSKSFDAMPGPLKDYVYRRFREVLTGEDNSPDFRHISEADRKAILEILHDTKPDF